MLRSLFAGISGLRVNQTMLDVTGNNIANSNTPGFKGSSTVFSDTLSQMLTGGSANNAATQRGGTNPIQVGLGVQLGATATNFNQGSSETTGKPTDLMITGDGMFIVKDGTQSLYTRAGAFSFDNTGTLVNPQGAKVQGYAPGTTTPLVDLTLPPGLASYNIAPDGKISGLDSAGAPVDVGQIALANFSNPAGLERAGGTMFRQTASSGTATDGVSGTNGTGTLMTGTLEMSNVDLAQEFTNLILAQRGFQANSRVITTSDSVLEELVNLKR
jgi:flagellar hook protein FlgE